MESSTLYIKCAGTIIYIINIQYFKNNYLNEYVSFNFSTFFIYIYMKKYIYINIYIYLPGKSFSFHSLSRENWLSCDLCIINPIHPNQPFSTILCNVFILTSLLFEEYILKSRIKRKYNLASINLKQNLLFHITNFISIPYSNCKINSKLYLNHILLLLTYFGMSHFLVQCIYFHCSRTYRNSLWKEF